MFYGLSDSFLNLRLLQDTYIKTVEIVPSLHIHHKMSALNIKEKYVALMSLDTSKLEL